MPTTQNALSRYILSVSTLSYFIELLWRSSLERFSQNTRAYIFFFSWDVLSKYCFFRLLLDVINPRSSVSEKCQYAVRCYSTKNYFQLSLFIQLTWSSHHHLISSICSTHSLRKRSATIKTVIVFQHQSAWYRNIYFVLIHLKKKIITK